mmetsp:Transcript_114092/g.227015  ORF Transcript_114092/g.227015 Transcript_114092/m.227015 type:complete len:157 (-) Transcript_114092:640-1110(-)
MLNEKHVPWCCIEFVWEPWENSDLLKNVNLLVRALKYSRTQECPNTVAKNCSAGDPLSRCTSAVSLHKCRLIAQMLEWCHWICEQAHREAQVRRMPSTGCLVGSCLPFGNKLLQRAQCGKLRIHKHRCEPSTQSTMKIIHGKMATVQSRWCCRLEG